MNKAGKAGYQQTKPKRNTSDYYLKNDKAYFDTTFTVDPSSFLEPFARRVSVSSLILDVGCGSGRDLLWLKKRGFHVIGFERSDGLAKLARQSARCDVIEGDFETYDFSKLSVDAILMSAAFVHVPHDKLARAFGNVIQALTAEKLDSRYAFVSLKEGKGVKRDIWGRTFYFWKHEELREIFKQHGFCEIDFARSSSVLGTGEVWLSYVLEK